MKTIGLFRHQTSLKGLLALAISSIALLTSCSNEDNTVTPSPDPQTIQLNGTWYCVYDATGVAVSEDDQSVKADYDLVADIYDFSAEGVGSLQRCFFRDDTEPVMVQGSLGYGQFSYTLTADGQMSMTLANDFGQAYPKNWEASYANDMITVKGVDGQVLLLERADQEMKEILNALLEQNGGGMEKYNVADYKPKGVNNSQWMKQLSDDRLVADLSLPGSHDACTAEGWHNPYLAFAFELTAKCQDLTISEQLKVGVRVFDLRPEHDLDGTKYVLRCSHGPAGTKMYVSDFFKTLKQFLADNPTEFCVVTVDLSATKKKDAWGKDFSALVNSAELKSMFADFKARLTVGEMRGKVLILSKEVYADKPLGGYCYGWDSYLELEQQQKAHITAADGSETPLWVQDYWQDITLANKEAALVRMLEASVQRDMTAGKPAWVINYPSAYLIPFSDSYREVAASTNQKAIDWLSNHKGSVGIIYMDFAGMDESPDYAAAKLYKTVGMKLVNAVINQNWKE